MLPCMRLTICFCRDFINCYHTIDSYWVWRKLKPQSPAYMFYCFIRLPLFELNFAIHVHGFILLSIELYLARLGLCFQSADFYFVKKRSSASPTIFTPRLQSPTASRSPAAGTGAPWCSKDVLTQPLPSKGLKCTDERTQVLSSGALCGEEGRNEAAIAVDPGLRQ